MPPGTCWSPRPTRTASSTRGSARLELGKPDPNPPLWQRQIAIGGAGPTGGDGTIASGIFANNTLYYAGGHNELNGHGSGGSIGAYNPGTGATEWIRQTEQPIIGAPAYVNGLIGYGEGNQFEVVNAANGQLLYSYQLPASTYGAVSIARSQFYVGDLNNDLYTFGLNSSTATPPADPNCPATLDPGNTSAGPVTCQDIRSPGDRRLRVHQQRGPDRDRLGRRDPRAPPTSSGSSPPRSPATRSPA